MKKCNLCHSVVNDKDECHICHNTLTYEPECQDSEEHYVWNKYYLVYLIKNIWFSLFCCIFGIVNLAINKFVLSELLIAAIICALISLAVSIFQGGLKKAITWKYADSYAPFKIGLWKYLIGAISVLFFIVG